MADSSVPEDPRHAENTLDWLLRLKPDADEPLQIATLGHDIERALEAGKVKRATYLLMEKICALNMGVTEALIGLDSPDTLRIVAEDLKFHIDRFLSAFNENMRGER